MSTFPSSPFLSLSQSNPRHPGSRTALALGALLLLASACGDDEPVSVSAPVAIQLKAEAGAVENNSITIDKSITTESGNPWGAFTSDIEAQLGGPPGDLDLVSLNLLLAASSEGYTELREVFDGTIEVQFEMNDTGTFFPVGRIVIDDATVGREISFTSQFEFSDVQGADLDKLLNGSFKVVMSGPVAADFEAIDGKADLQTTFTFAAFP